jgi:hypothetical protein
MALPFDLPASYPRSVGPSPVAHAGPGTGPESRRVAGPAAPAPVITDDLAGLQYDCFDLALLALVMSKFVLRPLRGSQIATGCSLRAPGRKSRSVVPPCRASGRPRRSQGCRMCPARAGAVLGRPNGAAIRPSCVLPPLGRALAGRTRGSRDKSRVASWRYRSAFLGSRSPRPSSPVISRGCSRVREASAEPGSGVRGPSRGKARARAPGVQPDRHRIACDAMAREGH